MKTIELIQKSNHIARVIDETIHEARISSDLNFRVAGGCFDVVLEHQKAVTILSNEKLFGSAFSLIRPIFETYIRGLWIFYCASKNEINKFLKDKDIPTLQKLIDSIEKCSGFDTGVLSKIKQSSYSSMCSYTHSGWLQIGRRFNDEYIESNYSDGEIQESINFANTIAMFAAHEIAKMTKDPTVVLTIRNLVIQNT